MAKEILELNKFLSGTVSNPSQEDIPEESASYSLNVNSTSTEGRLEGVEDDKLLTHSGGFINHPAPGILTIGLDDLVDFSTGSDLPTTAPTLTEMYDVDENATTIVNQLRFFTPSASDDELFHMLSPVSVFDDSGTFQVFRVQMQLLTDDNTKVFVFPDTIRPTSQDIAATSQLYNMANILSFRDYIQINIAGQEYYFFILDSNNGLAPYNIYPNPVNLFGLPHTDSAWNSIGVPITLNFHESNNEGGQSTTFLSSIASYLGALTDLVEYATLRPESGNTILDIKTKGATLCQVVTDGAGVTKFNVSYTGTDDVVFKGKDFVTLNDKEDSKKTTLIGIEESGNTRSLVKIDNLHSSPTNKEFLGGVQSNTEESFLEVDNNKVILGAGKDHNPKVIMKPETNAMTSPSGTEVGNIHDARLLPLDSNKTSMDFDNYMSFPIYGVQSASTYTPISQGDNGSGTFTNDFYADYDFNIDAGTNKTWAAITSDGTLDGIEIGQIFRISNTNDLEAYILLNCKQAQFGYRTHNKAADPPGGAAASPATALIAGDLFMFAGLSNNENAPIIYYIGNHVANATGGTPGFSYAVRTGTSSIYKISLCPSYDDDSSTHNPFLQYKPTGTLCSSAASSSAASVTLAVDGTAATSAIFQNRNVYNLDGVLLGKCTARNSDTELVFGDGLVNDIANDVELHIPYTSKGSIDDSLEVDRAVYEYEGNPSRYTELSLATTADSFQENTISSITPCTSPALFNNIGLAGATDPYDIAASDIFHHNGHLKIYYRHGVFWVAIAGDATGLYRLNAIDFDNHIETSYSMERVPLDFSNIPNQLQAENDDGIVRETIADKLANEDNTAEHTVKKWALDNSWNRVPLGSKIVSMCETFECGMINPYYSNWENNDTTGGFSNSHEIYGGTTLNGIKDIYADIRTDDGDNLAQGRYFEFQFMAPRGEDLNILNSSIREWWPISRHNSFAFAHTGNPNPEHDFNGINTTRISTGDKIRFAGMIEHDGTASVKIAHKTFNMGPPYTAFKTSLNTVAIDTEKANNVSTPKNAVLGTDTSAGSWWWNCKLWILYQRADGSTFSNWDMFLYNANTIDMTSQLDMTLKMADRTLPYHQAAYYLDGTKKMHYPQEFVFLKNDLNPWFEYDTADTQFTNTYGEDYYTTTRALTLEDVMQPGATIDAVFTNPTASTSAFSMRNWAIYDKAGRWQENAPDAITRGSLNLQQDAHHGWLGGHTYWNERERFSGALYWGSNIGWDMDTGRKITPVNYSLVPLVPYSSLYMCSKLYPGILADYDASGPQQDEKENTNNFARHAVTFLGHTTGEFIIEPRTIKRKTGQMIQTSHDFQMDMWRGFETCSMDMDLRGFTSKEYNNSLMLFNIDEYTGHGGIVYKSLKSDAYTGGQVTGNIDYGLVRGLPNFGGNEIEWPTYISNKQMTDDDDYGGLFSSDGSRALSSQTGWFRIENTDDIVGVDKGWDGYAPPAFKAEGKGYYVSINKTWKSECLWNGQNSIGNVPVNGGLAGTYTATQDNWGFQIHGYDYGTFTNPYTPNRYLHLKNSDKSAHRWANFSSLCMADTGFEIPKLTQYPNETDQFVPAGKAKGKTIHSEHSTLDFPDPTDVIEYYPHQVASKFNFSGGWEEQSKTVENDDSIVLSQRYYFDPYPSGSNATTFERYYDHDSFQNPYTTHMSNIYPVVTMHEIQVATENTVNKINSVSNLVTHSNTYLEDSASYNLPQIYSFVSLYVLGVKKSPADTESTSSALLLVKANLESVCSYFSNRSYFTDLNRDDLNGTMHVDICPIINSTKRLISGSEWQPTGGVSPSQNWMATRSLHFMEVLPLGESSSTNSSGNINFRLDRMNGKTFEDLHIQATEYLDIISTGTDAISDDVQFFMANPLNATTYASGALSGAEYIGNAFASASNAGLDLTFFGERDALVRIPAFGASSIACWSLTTPEQNWGFPTNTNQSPLELINEPFNVGTLNANVGLTAHSGTEDDDEVANVVLPTTATVLSNKRYNSAARFFTGTGVTVGEQGTVPADVDLYYKISLEYDNQYESELQDFPAYIVEAGSSGDNVWWKYVSIEINVPFMVAKALNKRVTGLSLYRKEAAGEADDYRLVKNVPFTHADWKYESTTLSWQVIIIDSGNSASYHSITGIPQDLKKPYLNYGLGVIHQGHFFVTKASHPMLKDIRRYIFKSQPDNIFTFNWTSDFVIMPEEPIAMAAFDSRLYVWGKKKMYKIDPYSLIIEEEYDGITIAHRQSFVKTEFGLFFLDKNNIYLHDGNKPNPIAGSILRSSDAIIDFDNSIILSGYRDLIVQTLENNLIPGIFYYGPKNSILITLADASANGKTLLFSLDTKRWDLNDAPKPFGACATIDGKVLISDGSNLYNYLDADVNKFYQNNTRAWRWDSKLFTMGHSTQEKVFKGIILKGMPSLLTMNTSAVDDLRVYVDDIQQTLTMENTKYTLKTIGDTYVTARAIWPTSISSYSVGSSVLAIKNNSSQVKQEFFGIGHLIKIGDEIMLISSVDTIIDEDEDLTEITVTRAQMGTTAEVHTPSGAALKVYAVSPKFRISAKGKTLKVVFDNQYGHIESLGIIYKRKSIR